MVSRLVSAALLAGQRIGKAGNRADSVFFALIGLDHQHNPQDQGYQLQLRRTAAIPGRKIRSRRNSSRERKPVPGRCKPAAIRQKPRWIAPRESAQRAAYRSEGRPARSPSRTRNKGPPQCFLPIRSQPFLFHPLLHLMSLPMYPMGLPTSPMWCRRTGWGCALGASRRAFRQLRAAVAAVSHGQPPEEDLKRRYGGQGYQKELSYRKAGAPEKRGQILVHRPTGTPPKWLQKPQATAKNDATLQHWNKTSFIL